MKQHDSFLFIILDKELRRYNVLQPYLSGMQVKVFKFLHSSILFPVKTQNKRIGAKMNFTLKKIPTLNIYEAFEPASVDNSLSAN